MKRNILWLLVVAVCLIQTALAQETVPVDSVPAVNARGYLVGPGDVITGKVLGENEFEFEATVNEDGNIEVPFFDKPIAATCKSERELRIEVTKLLTKYVRTPQLSLRVKERKSRPPVTVSGEVRNQQNVILTRKTRLLELLSFSGGATDDASGMIQVFRTQAPMCADVSEEIEWKAEATNVLDVPSRMYSLSSLRLGRDEANPVIFPGDIIIVQKAFPVWIVGEVRSPQGIFLKEGGVSLTEAIAKIGGITREAKTKDIKIYRLKSDSKDREIISVNFNLIKSGKQKDVMLEPYDIVEVDKTKKSIAQTILELATGTAKQAFSTIAGGLPNRILY